MNVLVINCGSSSLKYQLIDSVSEKVSAKGLCERIGDADNSVINHTPAGGDKVSEKVEEFFDDRKKAEPAYFDDDDEIEE